MEITFKISLKITLMDKIYTTYNNYKVNIKFFLLKTLTFYFYFANF
jgi:hypothetical protein